MIAVMRARKEDTLIDSCHKKPSIAVTPKKERKNKAIVKYVVKKNMPNDPKVDKFKAFELYFLKNVSLTDIAKSFNCSVPYIHKIIQPFKNLIADPQTLGIYEKNKTRILSTAEIEILKNMVNPETLKKASGNNLAYMFQQVFNANRLEKGQSTANISIRTQSASEYANDSEQLQTNASNPDPQNDEKDNNINIMQADAVSADNSADDTESSDV